jgi:hypothetical protein
LPLLASAALLAGCGGSSSGTAGAEAASTTAASPSGSVAATAGGSGGAAAGTTGAAAGATSGAAAARESATTPAPQSGAAGTRAAATSSPATAAGTYTYDTSGTVTAGTPRDASGTQTLTVDPPADGRQHSLLTSGQGHTDQDVVVRAAGTYLVRLAISNPAFTKEFRSATGVLLVPDPATIGRSWSWTAMSTDGKTKASVTAKVLRQETLTIGGSHVATTVIDSTLRLTGDVTYTGRTQSWYDVADRLPVKDHTKGSGTVSGLAFTTDITNVIRSTKPS